MGQDGPDEVGEREGSCVGPGDGEVAGLLRNGVLGQLQLLARSGHLGEDGLVGGRCSGVLDGNFAERAESVPDGECVLERGNGKAAEDGHERVELRRHAADDH